MHDHHDIEQLLKPLRGVSLSSTEKDRTRAFLEEYVAFRPARRSSLRSPFTLFSYPTLHPVPFLAALMLVVTTTSVAFASESALPGDLLYPVKVHVTEEARAALARTPEKKAGWAIERAERRIAEAAQLAAGDTLSETQRNVLAERAEEHLATAELTLPSERTESAPPARMNELEILRERVRVTRDTNDRIVRRAASLAIAAPSVPTTRSGARVAMKEARMAPVGEPGAAPIAMMAFSTDMDVPEPLSSSISETPTATESDSSIPSPVPPPSPPPLRTPEARSEAMRRALDPRLETAERTVRRAERVLGTQHNELRTIVSEAREERDRAKEATTTEERLIHTERAHERALRAIERSQELAQDRGEKETRERRQETTE